MLFAIAALAGIGIGFRAGPFSLITFSVAAATVAAVTGVVRGDTAGGILLLTIGVCAVFELGALVGLLVRHAERLTSMRATGHGMKSPGIRSRPGTAVAKH